MILSLYSSILGIPNKLIKSLFIAQLYIHKIRVSKPSIFIAGSRLRGSRLPKLKIQQLRNKGPNILVMFRVIKKYMLSLTRAIIYLQGVSGFRSRQFLQLAPGSGSKTMHKIKKILIFYLSNIIQFQKCIKKTIKTQILMKLKYNQS